MKHEYRNVGLFCLAITMIIFPAFWPRYFSPLLAGELDLPWIVHAHGIAMMSWCLLTIVQAFLASRGRLQLHRTLGYLSLALFSTILVLTTGLVTRSAAGVAAGLLEVAQRYDLLLFATSYGLAFYFRRRSELHLRFMVVALLGALPPAWSRFHFYYLGGFDLLDPGQSAVVLILSLLTGLSLVDRWSSGRWILPYPIAAVLVVVLQVVVSAARAGS